MQVAYRRRTPMMTRKQFLRSLAGVGVGVIGASALAGCGNDIGTSVDAGDQGLDEGPADDPGDTGPDGPIETLACTPATQISANHGHAVVVPAADVIAGVQKQYSIQGTSAHRHFITVTAAMFGKLRVGMPVEVLSGGVSHRHTVTITCAPPAPTCTPSSVIGTNHGHVLVVSSDDVRAGVEKSYDVTGTSSHAHTVTVTAAMFAQLASHQTVMTSATGGSHTHDVTITCA